MSAKLWKSIVAGLCGSIAHSLLMYLKSWAGLLQSFQPYEALQAALSDVIGTAINPVLPWVLSFLNGSTILSFAFGNFYRRLPGEVGAIKGLVFGLAGWMVMGLIFFPMIGLGLFALQVGLGVLPALFSLAMIMAYSITLGVVYDALNP